MSMISVKKQMGNVLEALQNICNTNRIYKINENQRYIVFTKLKPIKFSKIAKMLV